MLTVRVLLVRSAWTRMRAARITRALGPQLAALRDTHRDDPRKLAEATAELHRRHGSSPVALLLYWMTGSVATLVQQAAITRLLDRRPPPAVHRDRSAR